MNRNEIGELFQNEKVGEIFGNTEGGQGMINIEIEKTLTFKEIDEILESIDFLIIENFKDKNQYIYPNVASFIKKFLMRTTDLRGLYHQYNSNEFIRKLLFDNEEIILSKYKKKTRGQALKIFAENYLKEIKSIENKTYFNTESFFDDPVKHIIGSP